MTNKFLFKVKMSYTPKNNLDEAIRNYLVSQDATLINNRSDLTAFRKKIGAKVKELHEKNSRCKNIPLEIWSFSGDDESVDCGCCKAVIYNINQEFKSL